MTLHRCTDMSGADWLVQSATDGSRLITMGPDGFAAYARLRYIPDPADGQDENDVEVPEDHPDDLTQAVRALRVLAAFTSTPDDCFFAVWDGYGEVGDGPLLTGLAYRHLALFRGPLRGVTELPDTAPPAMVWPADQNWFFASDVDPTWAGIGAGPTAIRALLATPGLDVVAEQG
ncbi:MAG TPA: hypothetical protein VN408_34730 [Actinoplanes sp.]|nr:hypothetical protein [Actinoplanes sp.]